MIGFDMGGGGGSNISPERVQDAWDRLSRLWDDVVDFVTDLARAVFGWVETVIDIYRWVRVLVTEIYGVPMERWTTHHDERTCPQCGALDGQTWERNDGEYPPAHTNCRCSRTYAYTDWRTREIVTWERQRHQVSIWTWQITGWV
jgi:hypothetical protein